MACFVSMLNHLKQYNKTYFRNNREEKSYNIYNCGELHAEILQKFTFSAEIK